MKPQGKYLPADEALLTVPLNLLEGRQEMNWHSAPLLPSSVLDPCPAGLSLAMLLGKGAQLFVGTACQTRVYYDDIPEWKHSVKVLCLEVQGGSQVTGVVKFLHPQPLQCSFAYRQLESRFCRVGFGSTSSSHTHSK